MFNIHQKAIQNACVNNPDMIAQVMITTINSIRTGWYLVGNMNKDVNKLGLDSRFMKNRVKAKAFKYIHRNKKDIAIAFNDYSIGKMSLCDLLLYIAECPGLGLPKAGFVIQLALGKIGCLDSHNMERFGLSPSTFKFGSNATISLKRKKAQLYIDTCEKLGGCEYLWNTWCNYLADINPNKYNNGFHVSKLHQDFILGE